jgi:hypothetical protein
MQAKSLHLPTYRNVIEMFLAIFYRLVKVRWLTGFGPITIVLGILFYVSYIYAVCMHVSALPSHFQIAVRILMQLGMITLPSEIHVGT